MTTFTTLLVLTALAVLIAAAVGGLVFALAAPLLGTVLTLIFGVSVLGTLISSALFCYEESTRTGKPAMPLLNLCLRAAPLGILSQAAMFCLYPLGLWPGLWSRPTSGKDLVVMVHGLFHNAGAWALFRHRLHSKGYATACFSYSSWGTELEEVVRNLQEYLRDLAARNPGRNIHLVGHSLGGLLLRAALGSMETPENVRSVVTLGAPFGGSKLSPFAFQSLGRYLQYDGETVRRLAALPHPGHVRALALYSPVDGQVLPGDALHCSAPGWVEKETAPVSHVSMLYAESVFEDAKRWMREVSGN